MAEKQKILIVDDDANIAELIELYLTKECFQCMQAHDGEEALKKNASFQPDLILLDIMLPGIDGYDVCREIRKTSTVPIIMLSAKGEVFDKVLGVVAPPRIKEGFHDEVMGDGCVEKSKGVAGWYKIITERNNVHFLDAEGCEFNQIDFMHLTRKGHAQLAEKLAELVPTLL